MNKQELKVMTVEKANKIFDSVLELRTICRTVDEVERFDQILKDLCDMEASLIEEKE